METFKFQYEHPEHGDIYDVLVEVIKNTLLIEVDTRSDKLYRIIEERAYEIHNEIQEAKKTLAELDLE